MQALEAIDLVELVTVTGGGPNSSAPTGPVCPAGAPNTTYGTGKVEGSGGMFSAGVDGAAVRCESDPVALARICSSLPTREDRQDCYAATRPNTTTPTTPSTGTGQ